jgi:hypothetical protein
VRVLRLNSLTTKHCATQGQFSATGLCTAAAAKDLGATGMGFAFDMCSATDQENPVTDSETFQDGPSDAFLRAEVLLFSSVAHTAYRDRGSLVVFFRRTCRVCVYVCVCVRRGRAAQFEFL